MKSPYFYYVSIYAGLLLSTVLITWALKAQTKPEEKKYPVSLTIPEWEKTVSQLQWIQQQIKQSDMPSRNSVYANDSILTPLVQQIFYQINSQVQAENKQKPIQPKDSAKTKKN